MTMLLDKAKEVLRTLLPVVVLVLLLCVTIVDVEHDLFIRFVLGALLLLVGLSVFLWGIELSMNAIGYYMSKEVATSRSLLKILVLGFLLGFLITVAEPDLLILGSQIETASGGTMLSSVIVYVVSGGVGLTVALGVLRLLRGKPPYNVFMAIVYGFILILALFVAEEFLAISIDASGATTGALTTPFTLALTLGLAQVKGGKQAEANSFGLVGVMSAGPIWAIMLMSIITGQKHIQGAPNAFELSVGVLKPIMAAFGPVARESLIALVPITALFFLFNFTKFKIKLRELGKIVLGLLLTLIGLILFLTGVNSGFMEMGRVIGVQVAAFNQYFLIVVGFFLGMIVVLMEPAVHVLGAQIEEVTAGHIPMHLIKITLSLGVATAVALSMVRIVVPTVHLWYFLLPGFAIAILLSFFSDPVFVGIAFDAGGVASGPMTATFVLAFAQGAATMIPTADVFADGFGVIAMVAMAPVFSLNLLGTVFRRKERRYTISDEPLHFEEVPELLIGNDYDCLVVVVNRGFADEVVHLARSAGATGATILHGRANIEQSSPRKQLLPMELQPEKELILLITLSEVSERVGLRLFEDQQLRELGALSLYRSPTEAFIKTFPLNNPE